MKKEVGTYVYQDGAYIIKLPPKPISVFSEIS